MMALCLWPALLAAQQFQDEGTGLELAFSISDDLPHDALPEADFTVRNTGQQPLRLTLYLQLQRDSELHPQPPPDLEHGRNLAYRKPSQSFIDGELTAENTLTDARGYTHAATAWGQGGAELYQVIDLEKTQEIRRLRYTPSDANWARFVNVMVSESGQEEDYRPVAALQNVPLEGRWGMRFWPEFAPVNARYIRLEYHNKGEDVQKTAMAGQIEVFGPPEYHSRDAWLPPRTGSEVLTVERILELAPDEERLISMETEAAPGPGMYLYSWQVGYAAQEHDELRHRGHFGHLGINLPPFEEVRPGVWEMEEEKRRFGMNMGNPRGIARLREMGISAVRFENHKWDMMSPASGDYRFDGSVPPWRVPHDTYYEMFSRHNMLVMPYLFHTPPHYSRAPEDARRPAQHPPEELSRFGEFAFQSAARYGSRCHPPDSLLSRDQKSGMGMLSTYSLWNEPNLNNPDWGHFIGSLEEYFEMFRYGAEGIRRADPEARIATAGFAGTGTALLERLLRYEYEDGSRPADYADILNVHHYTGRQPPETARIDINVDRGADAEPGLSFEKRLLRLMHWRDYRLPKRPPVWLTETGYDTGGEQGISRREQAGRIPRLLQISLGSGIDKVFLYRITGDRPSKYAASGIWDGDAVPKPSHYTLATLIHQVDGYDEVFRLAHPDERAWIYAWRHGEEITLSAWAESGDEEHDLPGLGMELGSAQLTDSFGHTHPANIGSNHELTGFPVYITGFDEAAEALVLSAIREADARQEAYTKRRDRMADAPAPGWNFGADADDEPAAFDVGRPRFLNPVSCKESTYFDDAETNEDSDIEQTARRWLPDIELKTGCGMPDGSRFTIPLPPLEEAYELEIALRGQRAELHITDDAGNLLHHQQYDSAALSSEKGYVVIREEIEATALTGGGTLRLRFESYGGELHWLRLMPAFARE